MNIEMLKAKMSDAAISITEIADRMGVSRATLYRKMSSGEFSVNEATQLSKALGFTGSDVLNIFFNNEVA